MQNLDLKNYKNVKGELFGNQQEGEGEGEGDGMIMVEVHYMHA
jgi:hypothetical protein